MLSEATTISLGFFLTEHHPGLTIDSESTLKAELLSWLEIGHIGGRKLLPQSPECSTPGEGEGRRLIIDSARSQGL